MTNQTKTKNPLNRHGAKLHPFSLCHFLVFALLIFGPPAYAQLKVYPLPKASDHAPSKVKTKNTASRTQELIPRSLPFWDDFPWTQVNNNKDTLSNYPLDSLWVNNYTVWINNGLGLNPPSINVATFNGLDSAQNPYSDQVLSNGFRDSLTSQPIKLNDVLAGERSSVYLSFFYQWYGNGEPPDPNDYMQLEFKNDQGVWENVMTVRTVPSL